MGLSAAAKFNLMVENRRSSHRCRSGFAKYKAIKNLLSKVKAPKSSRKLRASVTKARKASRTAGPTLTQYNLTKLTNRRGEDQNAKNADQFILVERNLESSSYSKMTYVINSKIVWACYIGGDSMPIFRKHGVTRRWSAEAIGPISSDDCGYIVSNMPKLKPIYCASRAVRGFEMTIPNLPQFHAVFEKDPRRIFDWRNLQDFGDSPILVQESFQSVRQRLEQRAADYCISMRKAAHDVGSSL